MEEGGSGVLVVTLQGISREIVQSKERVLCVGIARKPGIFLHSAQREEGEKRILPLLLLRVLKNHEKGDNIW